MKRIIFLIIFLVGCSSSRVLDTTTQGDWSIRLVATHGQYGDYLDVQKGEDLFTIDVHQLKPWKVIGANIDGYENVLALGVYKKTPFDPKMAKRVFFYYLDSDKETLVPKLRISRLSNPMVDFCLGDLDGDGLDELVSIEKDRHGQFFIGVYDWTNFAFERNYQSRPLDREPVFVKKSPALLVEGKKLDLFLEGDEVKW